MWNIVHSSQASISRSIFLQENLSDAGVVRCSAPIHVYYIGNSLCRLCQYDSVQVFTMCIACCGPRNRSLGMDPGYRRIMWPCIAWVHGMCRFCMHKMATDESMSDTTRCKEQDVRTRLSRMSQFFFTSRPQPVNANADLL